MCCASIVSIVLLWLPRSSTSPERLRQKYMTAAQAMMTIARPPTTPPAIAPLSDVRLFPPVLVTPELWVPRLLFVELKEMVLFGNLICVCETSVFHWSYAIQEWK